VSKVEEFERLSLVMRLQHGLLAISCLVLIVTGMPLKFPYFWLSQGYFSVIGVEASGIIHRVGAVGLIVAGVAHMVWVVFTREGRRNLMAFLPSFYDVKTVFWNVMYFFGFRKERPRFARYSYFEKFDYWAVYWGCVIMIGSGILLWFEEYTMRYLPKWAMDVAHEAHSDEGLLATLAIIIWHFYNVHFNLDQFPMNWAWLTGKISKEEMMEHHALEYEAMVEAQDEPDADED